VLKTETGSASGPVLLTSFKMVYTIRACEPLWFCNSLNMSKNKKYLILYLKRYSIRHLSPTLSAFVSI